MFTALNEFFASPAAKKQATKDYHCTRPRRAQTHAFFCLHCSPIICSSSVSNRFVLLPNPSSYALSLVSLSPLAVVFNFPCFTQSSLLTSLPTPFQLQLTSLARCTTGIASGTRPAGTRVRQLPPSYSELHDLSRVACYSAAAFVTNKTQTTVRKCPSSLLAVVIKQSLFLYIVTIFHCAQAWAVRGLIMSQLAAPESGAVCVF